MKMILVAGALAVATTAPGTNLAVADSRDFIAELGQIREFVGAGARGQAKFQLSSDGSELRYELRVEKLENFTQAHIHLTPGALTRESLLNRFRDTSPKVEHGPIVVFLTDFMRRGVTVDGVLAKRAIGKSDLVGPLTGYPLSLLAELMARGDTYVALHVLQPVPPNNTFCCPVGMRGIIKAVGSR
jgi:hypothetical protein